MKFAYMPLAVAQIWIVYRAIYLLYIQSTDLNFWKALAIVQTFVLLVFIWVRFLEKNAASKEEISKKILTNISNLENLDFHKRIYERTIEQNPDYSFAQLFMAMMNKSGKIDFTFVARTMKGLFNPATQETTYDVQGQTLYFSDDSSILVDFQAQNLKILS